MTTTTSQGANRGRLSAVQKARMSARRALKAWLARLPKDIAADLEELFAMMSNASTEEDRKEIAATITELLYPDMILVEIDDTHQLDKDDPAARKRLKEYRKSIGKEITKYRRQKGLSQAQLGQAVGISQSHVCRLETGFHIPTHVTLEKVAEVLGICPSKIDPGFESTVSGNEQ